MAAGDDEVAKLLATGHVNPKTFEAELGLLCHKWITLTCLDDVIEDVDAALQALEGRRDVEFQSKL